MQYTRTTHWTDFIFFVFPVVKVKCWWCPVTVQVFRNLTITSSLELTRRWKLNLPFIAQFTIVANSCTWAKDVTNDSCIHTDTQMCVCVCVRGNMQTHACTHSSTVTQAVSAGRALCDVIGLSCLVSACLAYPLVSLQLSEAQGSENWTQPAGWLHLHPRLYLLLLSWLSLT